jgi:hypothetical protein
MGASGHGRIEGTADGVVIRPFIFSLARQQTLADRVLRDGISILIEADAGEAPSSLGAARAPECTFRTCLGPRDHEHHATMR